MASFSKHGPISNDLFTGLTFWLSRQVPMRQKFEDDLKRRGATLVKNESDADMRIVDDARKNLPTGENYYSYKFIDESIKNNRLDDLDKYTIGLKSAADRPVGSRNVTAKRTRRQFTQQDDQILYNWLEPYRESGGAWKGNKIYEQLARKHPHHPFQSWRSRYIDLVHGYTHMIITEHVDPFAAMSDNEHTPEPQFRSHKRRRLNGPQSDSPLPALPPPLLIASPPRATGTRNPPGLHPPNLAVAASEESEIVWEDSVGDDRPDVRSKDSTEVQSNDPDEILDDLQHAERPTDVLLDDRSSHDSRNGHTLVSNVNESSKPPSRVQVDANGETKRSLLTFSKLGKFSLKEAKELYRAVPYIHNVEPRNLDQTWETMVQERGQHAVADWRRFYETTILPEYMLRNKLATMDDLDEFVADFLAEEQYTTQLKPDIKEEPVLNDIPIAANETSSESEQVEEEPVAGTSSSHVSKHSHGRDHTNAVTEVDASAELREPSLAMQPRTILEVIEVRQNGDLVAQESSISQHQPPEPHMSQVSVVSPKKRLFGRTLDMATINSQTQNPRSSMDSIRTNKASLDTASASATSALVSTNESVSSSKRPPESGQCPPKSATTSQEEPVAHDTPDQGQRETSNGFGTVLDQDRTLLTHVNRLNADPLSEEVEEGGHIPSPALSDTGSEYVAFDTGPRRSQLWELGEDEIRNEVVDHEAEEESDDTSSRSSDHSKQRTPRKQMSPASDRMTTRVLSRSQPMEDDLTDEDSELEAQVKTEEEPESDVLATTNVENTPRIETQLLFERSVPEVGKDTTMFDLPAPEGGWEQFSDIEEELEDIHASVEIADLDEPEQSVLSLLSKTNEAATELSGAGHHRSDFTSAKKVLVISEHESEFTTSSGDTKSPTPNRTSEVQQQKPTIYPVSNGSDKTAPSSRTASSRTRNRDEADTEESSSSSDDQDAIESWFRNQPDLYNTIHPRVVSRLASISLQATVLNLSAATFTLRDMVASFQRAEATRRAQFQVDTRIKREYADSVSRPNLKPRTRLTEEEARSFLPGNVLGVWTIGDDRNLLSQTIEGLEKVKGKHGSAAVRKRTNFLRIRYGEGDVTANMTPTSKLGCTKKPR